MAIKASLQSEDLFLELEGPGVANLICIGARMRDRLSTIAELRMEVAATDAGFTPKDVLGTKLTLKAANGFRFTGLCISVEDLGHRGGIDYFALEVRPWLWLMTIGADNRVFQYMKTVDIVTEVFRDAGFTDITTMTDSALPTRDYCVQYGESNFAFVSRLLEEEGIYYYFDHSGQSEKIKLVDSVSGHSNAGTVQFTAGNQMGDRQGDSNSVFEWSEAERVVTGKVSLWDYNMTIPSADLRVSSVVASGSHSHKSIERYVSHGHYIGASEGEAQARAEVEGHASQALRARGDANSPLIATGAIFTLDHPERDGASGEYLVLGCTHFLLFNAGYDDFKPDAFNRHVERIHYPSNMGVFQTEFEVQKRATPFRPPRVTKWPEVPSLLTALVTGPDGEEIHTDEFGRIKVQFPWDRKGKNDEASSVWVRSVMPWGGKDWGMFSVPRIGMEVIIQFERGNIDRPYCTGVVYNGVNNAPYSLPDGMNKTGIRTNSTKGGGGFHELTFDDTKNKEEVFFQSERDYKQIVKANADVTIGMEHSGNLTQTIQGSQTDTLKEGDLTTTLEKGSRITTIKQDDTEKIDGKQDVTIKDNTTLTITDGNLTETIAKGNHVVEVTKGDAKTTIGKGNFTLNVDAGKVAIKAAQEITLTVGASSITIGPAAITLKSTKVTVEADAMTEVKGALVKVEANGLVQVSGKSVMIN